MSGTTACSPSRVSGRGLVDPASRCSPPTTRGSRAAARRSRRCASTAVGRSGSPSTSRGSPARPSGSASSRPTAARSSSLAALALERAATPEAVLRLVLDAGRRPAASIGAIALVSAIPDWIEDARERGQRLVSLLHQRRSAPWLLPATKSTSYAVNIAAEAEAKARGADDAVFVDGDGIVLEGPVTNIWWREGDVLLTPSLEVGILAGETRAALLELAAARRARSSRRASSRSSGSSRADEVFTSSSIREVMPVVALDGRPFARGPAAAALQEALRDEARRGGAERAAGRRVAGSAAVDDEMRAADRVVALDVAILGRHPDLDPGAPRRLAVARDPRASRTSYGASTQTRTA